MSYQEDKFKEIANAIRTKDGTTSTMQATDFANRILAIPTGGGGGDSNLKRLLSGEETTLNGSDLSGMTILGNYAFYGMVNLVEIEIAETIVEIGASALYGCTGLNNLTIPENITSIGNSAFSKCSNITLINYNAKEITSALGSAYIFEYACNNASVIIGNEVLSIPASLFITSGTGNVPNISSVIFQENSKCNTIGNGAFRSLPITSITVPENVANIGNSAFSSCRNVIEINFNAKNLNDLSNGNYVFQYVGNDTDGVSVKIGQNVEKIPAYIFCPSSSSSTYSPNIITVNFAENSKCSIIGQYAFARLNNMIEVKFSANLTSITANAFSNCTNMQSYDFSECSSIPTLASTTAFTNIPSDCQILVPSELYDTWRTSTNWSTYSSRMVAV